MTAIEKAKELYSKYNFVEIPNYSSKHEVKQCALIAVDEIIESLKITIGHCDLGRVDLMEVQKDFGFWYSVKEEIEKI